MPAPGAAGARAAVRPIKLKFVLAEAPILPFFSQARVMGT